MRIDILVFMRNFACNKRRNIMSIQYFSEETISQLKPQQRLSERYQSRAQDVTLACKLTHVYEKYNLAMLHRVYS